MPTAPAATDPSLGAATTAGSPVGGVTSGTLTPQFQPPSMADIYASMKPPEASLYGQKLSNEDFLNQAYQQILGRAPDVGGQKYWADQLAGGASQQDVEKAILASQEEKNKLFVDQLYQSDFGRAPDAGGEQYWMSQLNSGGMTPEQIQAKFLNSPEMQGYTAQGITPDPVGQVDPFVAGYNARMANAQRLYGGIAQGNAIQNTADQQAYQQQLEKVQAANQERLAAAQQAKADRQAREAEAARQQALAVAMMMMMRH